MTDTADLDLFGNPIEPLKDPRGRPRFAKSQQNQQFVMTARAAGWTHDKIATFLRCDPKTLRANFSRELEAGATMIEGMALQVIVQKMMGGNLRAARELCEMAQATVPSRPSKAAEAKPAPLGKKEQAAQDAQQPAGGWAEILGEKGLPN